MCNVHSATEKEVNKNNSGEDIGDFMDKDYRNYCSYIVGMGIWDGWHDLILTSFGSNYLEEEFRIQFLV